MRPHDRHRAHMFDVMQRLAVVIALIGFLVIVGALASLAAGIVSLGGAR